MQASTPPRSERRREGGEWAIESPGPPEPPPAPEAGRVEDEDGETPAVRDRLTVLSVREGWEERVLRLPLVWPCSGGVLGAASGAPPGLCTEGNKGKGTDDDALIVVDVGGSPVDTSPDAEASGAELMLSLFRRWVDHKDCICWFRAFGP
jgi:hypothetical protein